MLLGYNENQLPISETYTKDHEYNIEVSGGFSAEGISFTISRQTDISVNISAGKNNNFCIAGSLFPSSDPAEWKDVFNITITTIDNKFMKGLLSCELLIDETQGVLALPLQQRTFVAKYITPWISIP